MTPAKTKSPRLNWLPWRCSFFVKCFITNSISLLVTGLFGLSISSWISFVLCVFLRICSFHLIYLICWHTVVYSVLFNPFYLSLVGSNGPSFVPDFGNMKGLTFFLGQSTDLSILLFFSRNQLFVSLISSVIFYSSFCQKFRNSWSKPVNHQSTN